METVNIRNEGAICIIEMDRPDALNAFNSQLMDDLADAFLQATADSDVKVAVLTGAGRAFTAGADLKEMGRQTREPKHGLAGMLEAIIDFPKPLIIAINGVGAGIGATICGLGDFVFMSDQARLRCPFSALGLTAEAASTFTFPRLMGHQRAAWFLMASEWMDAETCQRSGLAMEVLPGDKLMPYVMEKAAILAALPLASLQKTKALMMDPIRQQMKDAVLAENKGLAELSGSAANIEAIKAFAEKRDPDFTGL